MIFEEFLSPERLAFLKDRRRSIRLGLIAGSVILLFVIGLCLSSSGNGPRYITVRPHRGDLRVTVTATGKLEPVNQVEVGTEVSGTVRRVYVDFNQHVRAGQLLARLDTQKLDAQITQLTSALDSARANIAQARASVLEAEENLKRLQALYKASGGQAPSKQVLDTAVATLRKAQASETAAKAQSREAAARLSMEKVTLSKASIRSPIRGIVLQRQIEPGQTVAASLQTPTLFIIAENLSQLRLIVAVAEADIGLVKVGQKASFTVDAYGDREFPAKITQVRYASKTTENVVTYDTVLLVNNGDLKLRPGMTATASIIANERKNVLLVPNVALRFRPENSVKQEKSKKNNTGILGMLFSRPWHRTTRRKATENKKEKGVYLLRDNRLLQIPLETGISDGIDTEVVSGNLKPEDRIITGIKRGQ